MALAAVDKSLPDAKWTARARRVVGRIEGQLTTLDEGDRRTGVAVPTGMAAGRDDDLLHDRILRVRDMYDLALVSQLDFDVHGIGKRRSRHDRPHGATRQSR